jgi:2,3-dihydroxybiphenyl 1,2-dioxygenase
MAAVSQLGYLGIGVSDIEAWKGFATGVLGLAIGEVGRDGAVRFRMDEYSYRFALYPGGNDDLAYIGWEVPDRGTLETIAQQLEGAGVAVTRGNEAERATRQVFDLIKFTDPNGVASEVFYGPLISASKFVSPRSIAGFKTGAMGLGHFIVMVDDLDRSMSFYQSALGMRVSDYVSVGMAPGKQLTAGFLHCNPRHHSLALIARPNPPKRLNHFMLELNSMDDVGATYYLCEERGVPLATSLGRHTNDQMFSFYMKSPSGFQIEYGWGARHVDDRTWQVQVHSSGSLWGHRPASK